MRIVVGSVGAVKVKRLLVSPVVSEILESKEVVTLPRAEDIAEQSVPRTNVEVQPGLNVPLARIVSAASVMPGTQVIKSTLFPILAVARTKPLYRILRQRLSY